MGRWVPCLLSLGLLAPAARAEVEVRVSDERVDVTATAAPLADVLDQLARQIGMEIVYDGQPPRQHVTLALEDRSPAEAVQGILEGQGLNYALLADPSGRRVQTLLLAGPVGKGSGTPPARPAAPRARRPFFPPGAGPDMMGPDMMDPDMMDPDMMDPDAEEPFDEQELMEEEEPAQIPQGEGEQPPGFPAGVLAPGVPAPGAPAPGESAPGAGMLPFPGGQPQVYPASPFTPQPFSPLPPAETEPDAEPPPQ
jgi:hypothetical protein